MNLDLTFQNGSAYLVTTYNILKWPSRQELPIYIFPSVKQETVLATVSTKNLLKIFNFHFTRITGKHNYVARIGSDISDYFHCAQRSDTSHNAPHRKFYQLTADGVTTRPNWAGKPK